MRNVTQDLLNLYLPTKALILYQHEVEKDYYIESYDMDDAGSPINARSLTVEEAGKLATTLQYCHKQEYFLHLSGLLPSNVLYFDARESGYVLWHTSARKMNLFFKNELGIPSGKGFVPPLLWKASTSELYIYALEQSSKPTLKTPLFHAPFFNVYEEGKVCMGTVDIEIGDDCSLQDFIKAWQQYFFNSYFSHVIDNIALVSGNIVQIWKEQMASGKRFPVQLLKKHYKTIKQLLP